MLSGEFDEESLSIMSRKLLVIDLLYTLSWCLSEKKVVKISFEFKTMLIISVDKFFSGMLCLLNYPNSSRDFKSIMNCPAPCFVFIGYFILPFKQWCAFDMLT